MGQRSRCPIFMPGTKFRGAFLPGQGRQVTVRNGRDERNPGCGIAELFLAGGEL